MEISLYNSKTGPAFSLPEGVTCPGKTKACEAVCYVKHGRMALPVAKNKRQRNLSWWTTSTKRPTAPWEQMVAAIRAAKTKTLRIHDAGDFMSPEYTRQWFKTCDVLASIKFWAYTRSWSVPGILTELKSLARLTNVAIWLSADISTWISALVVLRANPEFAGIAYMQQADTGEIRDSDISRILARTLPKDKLVIFPVHGAFGRINAEIQPDVPNCPAITKEIPCSKAKPACLTCLKCLPQ